MCITQINLLLGVGVDIKNALNYQIMKAITPNRFWPKEISLFRIANWAKSPESAHFK